MALDPRSKRGVYFIVAAIGLTVVLLPMESRTDASLAGLAITFIAMPMLLIGLYYYFTGVAHRVTGIPGTTIGAIVIGGVIIAFVFLWAKGRTPGTPNAVIFLSEIRPAPYFGPCPAVFQALVHLTVQSGSGDVRFVLSANGRVSGSRTVYFAGPGKKTVTMPVELPPPGFRQGSVAVSAQVIEPPRRGESRKTVSITCTRQ